MRLDDAAMICMHGLISDLIHEERIEVLNDTLLIFTGKQSKRIAYKRIEARLLRNGRLMHPPEVRIEEMNVIIASAPVEGNRWQDFQSMGVDNFSEEGTRIIVEMTLAHSKKRISLRSVVRPRNLNKSVFEGL